MLLLIEKTCLGRHLKSIIIDLHKKHNVTYLKYYFEILVGERSISSILIDLT